MKARRSHAEPVTGVDEIRYLLERRRFDQARRVLSSELSQSPDDPDLLYLGAHLDCLQDRNDDALKTVNLVLSRAPHHCGAREVLFNLHLRAGRFPEAEQAILSLLKDYPGNGEYFADYSELMLRAFEVDKARRLAEEAIRLAPSNEQALRAAVLCSFVLDTRAELQNKLSELLRQYPDSEFALGTVGSLLVLQNRPREALVLAQGLLRENPGQKILVDLIVTLKAQTHWTMLPLWPQQRFGRFGIAGFWITVLFVIGYLDETPLAPWKGAAINGAVLFFLYNCFWPPLLFKALKG